MTGGWLRPDWNATPGVRAAVSTRLADGVSAPPFDRFNLGLRSGDEVERVRENRRRVRAQLALPTEPCWLQQVHGTAVAVVGDAATVDEPVADAAMTRRRGLALAILAADCLPVLLCDEAGSVVAAAHAGWRGLAAGVIEQVVTAMEVAPSHLQAWLGPCIGATSYEIGEEVRAAFVDGDAAASRCFVPTRPGHWHADLAALARRRLAATGVTRVGGGGFDTFTDARFYSYRRDGARSGRFVSLVWLD